VRAAKKKLERVNRSANPNYRALIKKRIAKELIKFNLGLSKKDKILNIDDIDPEQVRFIDDEDGDEEA
jgi:hypothetical protein